MHPLWPFSAIEISLNGTVCDPNQIFKIFGVLICFSPDIFVCNCNECGEVCGWLWRDFHLSSNEPTADTVSVSVQHVSVIGSLKPPCGCVCVCMRNTKPVFNKIQLYIFGITLLASTGYWIKLILVQNSWSHLFFIFAPRYGYISNRQCNYCSLPETLVNNKCMTFSFGSWEKFIFNIKKSIYEDKQICLVCNSGVPETGT